MALIPNLKPGQTVWKIWPTCRGGTRIKHDACCPVYIVETDSKRNSVKAQWGGNPPRWYGPSVALHWRVKQPRGVKLKLFKALFTA